MDQGAGTLPAHHRSNQGVPSCPPKEAQATEDLGQYYKELTGRCTSAVRPLKIEVEGHTCRCGSDAANRELGRKRAEAIRGFLITSRAAGPDDITAISYGSSRPVESAGAPSLPAAVCDRDEIHSQNRRVVIVIYTQANVLTKTPPPLSVSFLSRRAGTSGYERLSDGGQLRTGDEFAIRLHAATALYAYAFHLGSSGKWDVLFPDRPALGQSERPSNFLESGQEVSLPNASEGFKLIGDSGREETYVYSSSAPDQMLEGIVKNIQQGAIIKELLPPALVGVKAETPQAKQRTPPSPPSIPIRENQAGKKGQTPSGPGGQSREGEIQIPSRDLARPDASPHLPPNPAAYVRFQHLN